MVANTLIWPVGSHTNTSSPSNIAFIDKRSSSFRYVTSATSEQRITQLWKNMDYYIVLLATTLVPHAMMILNYYCGRRNSTIFTSPLHIKLPGYPIFWLFLEIKAMHKTVCTRRFSSPLLQIGIGMLGNEARTTVYSRSIQWNLKHPVAVYSETLITQSLIIWTVDYPNTSPTCRCRSCINAYVRKQPWFPKLLIIQTFFAWFQNWGCTFSKRTSMQEQVPNEYTYSN